MSKKAYTKVGPRVTPQSEPIPGSSQVANSAGGYSWQVDDWQRLMRFLILGSEGGTYYIKEHDLTVDNAQAVVRCIQADGQRVVQTVIDVSQAGRAPKNSPALFVLAMCANASDSKTRKYALHNLPLVARTGTHLFEFCEYVQSFRGWGRGLRNAVGRWYTGKSPDQLAYQLIKYRQREGWTHHDVLCLAHPSTKEWQVNNLLSFAVTGQPGDAAASAKIMEGYFAITGAGAVEKPSVKEAAAIIREYKLPREAVPTDYLTDKEIWAALLEDMPLMAMVRNLGNMSKVGLLTNGKWDVIQKVVDSLNPEQVKRSRIHPIQLLAAQVTYGSGKGARGSGIWDAVPQIVDALDAAFYMAFENVEPTGKSYMLGVDVSGSMDWEGSMVMPGMTARVLAGAMAMVWMKTEPKSFPMGFSHELVPLNISAKDRLDRVCDVMRRVPMGGTDCALPILYAQKKEISVDVFVILTDNETWAGQIHPAQALVKYRATINPRAKLVVVGMTANDFSIADPGDPNCLDVVGFDTSTPLAVSEFVKM